MATSTAAQSVDSTVERKVRLWAALKVRKLEVQWAQRTVAQKGTPLVLQMVGLMGHLMVHSTAALKALQWAPLLAEQSETKMGMCLAAPKATWKVLRREPQSAASKELWMAAAMEWKLVVGKAAQKAAHWDHEMAGSTDALWAELTERSSAAYLASRKAAHWGAR